VKRGGNFSPMWRMLVAVAVLAIPLSATASPLTPQQTLAIDTTVREWLAETDAPSVSIAVVADGKLAYAQAYGNARLHPDRRATPQIRYPIFSATKEFTAAAILALQDEGKLSLDDKIAKYFPDLAGADKVSIRQLLNHTAGYREFWLEDFVSREKARPVAIRAILNKWATQPLDFEPGTKWNYSNTNFVIAGAIVEKVSGEPYFAFLQKHIFAPLDMNDVVDDDGPRPDLNFAVGYTRYGEGPWLPAAKAGWGWEYAAGGLAMTPGDLAKWDISVINRSLLKRQAYDALYTPVKLKSGENTKYSLGLGVYVTDGRLNLQHGGDGPGFSSENMMWPAEKIAVIALTNNDWTHSINSLRSTLIPRVAYVVLPPTPAEARARAIFDGFQRGTLDRKLFSDDANAFLTPSVLADQKKALAPSGPPRAFTLQNETDQDGWKLRNWKIRTTNERLLVEEIDSPDGKVELFAVSKAY
jgi:CubicO group peptidase (beta-lactamase class C family)